MSRRRLFVAARLPEALLPTLQAAHDILADKSRVLRLAGVDSLHLTLRFIGEVEEELASRIVTLFKSLRPPALEDCRLAVSGYGFFPGRDGRLVWAGLACGDGFYRFRDEVQKGLAGLGLAPDLRPLLPHVTLARKATFDLSFPELELLLPRPAQLFQTRDFVLFESFFQPEGTRYEPLAALRAE